LTSAACAYVELIDVTAAQRAAGDPRGWGAEADEACAELAGVGDENKNLNNQLQPRFRSRP
jgi:hypothetical protein